MVKAKTKALNLLLPETLSDWFTEYAKIQNKTKTEIICTLLQGIKNGEAYSDVVNLVDNPVDDIEAIIKTYLDNHLHNYVENILYSSKQADVVNPVDKLVESVVDDSVVNPVDDSVESVVDDSVVNPVDDSVESVVDNSDALPIIEAIATIAAPSIENPLHGEILSDAIAATDLSKGMKINEAFEIAKSRGYKGTESKSFRDGYRKNPDFGKQFGLDRVEFKDGKDRWLYFDTKA